jgi:Retrotransposon gag protein
MSSDEEERPPTQLLQPLVHFENPTKNVTSTSVMPGQRSTVTRKPYQITFATRDEEVRYIEELMNNCTTYDGNPDTLAAWLKGTGAYLLKERVPETDHPFIIRHLLIDDALDFYQAHEDIIINFYDLRKLFLHKQNTLTQLRTVSSFDPSSFSNLNITSNILTSTQQLGAGGGTNHHSGVATTVIEQSLEELTQNDIRKTVLEDLQRNYTKFSGEHRQDVVKWLINLENKFETANIPPIKKFDLITQLLEKGALDWFQENKVKLNRSWDDFVLQLKKTFDSPNRARLAMQKLNCYVQSPQQDVRSFCREMRRLCCEADPQMSGNMKLELMLAKINPSYRLDLLKQKPKDPEEFETMAIDLENTYLVYDTLEQSGQPNLVETETTVTNHPWEVHNSSRDHQQTSNTGYLRRFNQQTNYSNFNSRATANGNNSMRSDFRNSNYSRPQNQIQYSRGRQFRRYPFYRPGQHPNKLFAYQPVRTSESNKTEENEKISPLMTVEWSENGSLASNSDGQNTIPVICQWCSSSGHTARNCPFSERSQ